MKQKRESNIELLRILTMLGVIILHYNNKSIGGAFEYVDRNSSNYYLLMSLESIAICAVNLFMLISGFFMCQKKKTIINKPLELLFQVIVFSFSFNLIFNIIKGSVSINSIIGGLVPANYFVILYIVVYLLSPYLNHLYGIIDTKFLVILLSVFSIYPTLVELFNLFTGKEWAGLSSIGLNGSQSGYHIVNFIMMYYVGMYIRKYIDKLRRISMIKIIFCLFIVGFVITAWGIASDVCEATKNLSRIYCNPLLVIEAAALFLIFYKINIGYVRLINKISSAAFTVFITHSYFITHVGIKWAVQQGPIIMLLHLTLTTVGIYLVCFIIFVLYSWVSNTIINNLLKKEIVITDIL